jgi:lactoylglutathione lyase
VTSILAQFCIHVRDMGVALEFWEGACELKVQNRVEIPDVLEVMLQADEGGSRLQLAQRLDRDDPIDQGDSVWKIYINTSDCQRTYDRCIAMGAESVTEPKVLDRWPVTVAFVRDPDGYLVEFVEHHKGTRDGVPNPKDD